MYIHTMSCKHTHVHVHTHTHVHAHTHVYCIQIRKYMQVVDIPDSDMSELDTELECASKRAPLGEACGDQTDICCSGVRVEGRS